MKLFLARFVNGDESFLVEIEHERHVVMILAAKLPSVDSRYSSDPEEYRQDIRDGNLEVTEPTRL